MIADLQEQLRSWPYDYICWSAFSAIYNGELKEQDDGFHWSTHLLISNDLDVCSPSGCSCFSPSRLKYKSYNDPDFITFVKKGGTCVLLSKEEILTGKIDEMLKEQRLISFLE